LSGAARRDAQTRGGGPGPLVGWRAWRVVVAGGCLRLRSAVFDADWSPGTPLAAGCAHGHKAPALDCVCGIYASRTPAEALRYLVGRNDPDVVHRVAGEVQLWGLTVEGEHGWRAARAYPHRIWVPPRQTNALAVDVAAIRRELAAYRVPVTVLDVHEPATIAGSLAA
jgi:hypothetical protein